MYWIIGFAIVGFIGAIVYCVKESIRIRRRNEELRRKSKNGLHEKGVTLEDLMVTTVILSFAGGLMGFFIAYVAGSVMPEVLVKFEKATFNLAVFDKVAADKYAISAIPCLGDEQYYVCCVGWSDKPAFRIIPQKDLVFIKDAAEEKAHLKVCEVETKTQLTNWRFKKGGEKKGYSYEIHIPAAVKNANSQNPPPSRKTLASLKNI